jgi:hypothetical protein
MASLPTIGFNRRIKLEWLAETARMAANGLSDGEIIAALRITLQDQMSIGRNPERGSREKAITILMKTWVRVPKELRPFREQGLGLLRRLPPKFHPAIHWAAAMVAYPFFGDVAQTVGRLIRLQDDVAINQMKRRMKERYGEKETVARSARYVLNAFLDWGVLSTSGIKGTYVPAPRLRVSDGELLAWMAEALLLASDGGMKPVEETRQSLMFFPFDVSGIDITTLPLNPRLDVFRHGVGEQWVSLRESRRQPSV